MRVLLLSLFALVASSCALFDGKDTTPEVTHIRLRYMVADDFKRIGEYRTGREYRGDRLILRSQPATRDGYYFILLLNKNVRRIPYGTQIILDVLTPYDTEPRNYVFELPTDKPSTRDIFLGLTGSDWESESEIPIAWKVTLKQGDRVFHEKKSYLWTF